MIGLDAIQRIFSTDLVQIRHVGHHCSWNLATISPQKVGALQVLAYIFLPINSAVIGKTRPNISFYLLRAPIGLIEI